MTIFNNREKEALLISVDTNTNFEVAEQVRTAVEKALQQVLNDCSTEFYRNIKAEIKIIIK